MRTNTTARTGAAFFAIAALCMGPATLAFADAGDPYKVGGVNQEAANKALVNKDATVQLSIHKYLGAPTSLPHNGTQQTVTGLPTLGGVNFDVFQVLNADGTPVDLTTNAGWEAASVIKSVMPATYTDGTTFVAGGKTYSIKKVSTVTTAANGTATFTQPKGTGLYFVNENLATSGTITSSAGGTVDKGTITPANPFYVTLPMTNPDDTSRWMYDVSVYPKNQSDSITKSVVDKGTVTTDNGNVGSHQLDYTITSSITDSTDPLGMYVIYDDLDPALSLTGASLKLSDGTALAAADYKVYTAPNWTTAATAFTGTAVSGGPVVTIVLTDSGLAKLEANRALSVVTTLNTTVAGIDADGVVPNHAAFIPNQGWWDQNSKPGVNPETPDVTPPGGEPGIPSTPVETKYGNLIVDKYDPQNAAAPMAGAVFQLFKDANNDDACDASDVTAPNVAINTATIGADNKATFAGLQTSNWYNGAAQTDLLGYCLIETKAPTGYNLDATPRFVTIDWTTGTATAPAYATQRVANEQSNLGNSLPLTGGAGAAGISLLALALVGGGIGYYVVSSRRRDEQHDA